MTRNEYIASIMLEAAGLLKEDNEVLDEFVVPALAVAGVATMGAGIVATRKREKKKKEEEEKLDKEIERVRNERLRLGEAIDLLDYNYLNEDIVTTAMIGTGVLGAGSRIMQERQRKKRMEEKRKKLDEEMEALIREKQKLKMNKN